MQVDDQKEDQLVEFEKGFEFFGRAQVGDNLAQTKHSDQLQGAKEFECGILAAEYHLSDGIKGQRGQDVNGKLATQVVPVDHLHVFDLSTSSLIDVGGAKADDDIDEEEQVDDVVEEFEPKRLKRLWAESHVQRDNEHVECRQYHDEQIPLCLARVIDTQQAWSLRLCLPLGLKEVFHITLLLR